MILGRSGDRLFLSSGVNVEGEEFVGVLVVEGAEVGQTQQEFGEERAVLRPPARDESAKSADQILLELLYGAHVWYSWAIWYREKQSWVTGILSRCINIDVDNSIPNSLHKQYKQLPSKGQFTQNAFKMWDAGQWNEKKRKV